MLRSEFIYNIAMAFDFDTYMSKMKQYVPVFGEDICIYYYEKARLSLDKKTFMETEYSDAIIDYSEESVGLGDTIAKITHATGLDKLAEMYTKITGRPCGCQQRQEALNKLFPYGVKEEE